VSLSTSDFAADGFLVRNFRRGQAPWQERELGILVPVADEVELVRKATLEPKKSGFAWVNENCFAKGDTLQKSKVGEGRA
jgi:hypothetical protein